MADNANNKIFDEILDIMLNDSENPKRLLPYLSDDCVWTIEPGGTRYKDLLKFRDLLMSQWLISPKTRRTLKE